ncbi:MAG TPA: hypothetical protein VF101_00105 [Gaiellaceae bacterium]
MSVGATQLYTYIRRRCTPVERVIRAVAWTAAGAMVVLASRSLSYALAPHPDIVAGRLETRLGGPRLVVLVVAAPAVALALATAVVWIASVAVRERRVLERRRIVDDVPPISAVAIATRTVLLGLATCTAFALLESYLHWRAGLGWHGVRCLVGPEHRDALPFLWALSLLATAIVGALEHLVAWMRRTVATLLARVPRLRLRPPAAPRTRSSSAPRPRLLRLDASPRGPPQALVTST